MDEEKNNKDEKFSIQKIKNLLEIKIREIDEVGSGFVGTFHYSEFIDNGKEIKKGDKLGYIEALNHRNYLYSIVDGVIYDIKVENGAPVDYGKTLILIEISKKGLRRVKKIQIKQGLESKVEETTTEIKKETEQKPIQELEDKVEETNVFYLKSPMVGIFYTRSSPESKPYVEVGSEIDAKDPVCIIEAMKLMNEIKPKDYGFKSNKGQILEILVENKESVEKDQDLMKIKPIY